MASPILFFADEHFRQSALRHILAPHRIEFMKLQAEDPEIVMAAESSGAIIVTADTWFHGELRQGDYHEMRRARRPGAATYGRAGVIVVAGEWAEASRQLMIWLPLIEVVAEIQ